MKYIYIVTAFILFGCSSQKSDGLKTSYINPASGYTQVVVSEYNGLKTIHVSGQIGEGDDLQTQMSNALKNLQLQLNASGADFKDIVKMNHYIVNYRPEQLSTFRNTRKQIMGDANMPASTLVGVTSLFADGYLIEIDAIAIIEN